jgi:hypothetical protein|tara:strand:- start:3369 stop:3980 length:612 start_codon:yes stop_codon:yes gene_type:complete
MAEARPLLNGPVPGQSLTAELGARPWQQPAKYIDVEDALEFYANKITDPKINDSLLDSLEMGAPVTTLAEVLVQSGAMEGLHTIDMSIMLLPVIMELIAYTADEAGVKYEMGIEGKIDQDIIPEGKIALAMKKIEDKMSEDSDEEELVEPVDLREEEDEPQSNGLMARGEPETDQEPMETTEEQPEAPSEAGPETNSLMARRV